MANEITKLIIETILKLITTAFAFVADLAWNDIIQALTKQFIGTGDALPSLFIYTINSNYCRCTCNSYYCKICS